MHQQSKHEKAQFQLCSVCGVGQLETRSVVYARMIDELLLTIPDVAALACDVCGYREFDLASFQDIEAWKDESGMDTISAKYSTPTSRRQQS